MTDDTSIDALLRCPRCGGVLVRDGERLRCDDGPHVFPVVLGIPDLRLSEDPLIPLADDYAKGEKVLRAAETRTWAELVAYYWTLPTYPPTPPALAARFVHHVQTDAERIAAYADLLGTGARSLDVGCGAGALVRASSRRFGLAVGVDVGFRWLVVARHGLREAGAHAEVVCANADHLPFAAGSFDTVTSVALLEHVPDAAAVLRETARVARPGGRTLVWTSNRYALTPEPHVRVWGVGFLPRRWMPAYVRWRSGLAYEHKRLLGRGELARTLRRTGHTGIRFHLPAVAPADLRHASPLERAGAGVYARLRRVPFLRSVLVRIFPALLATATSAPERRP